MRLFLISVLIVVSFLGRSDSVTLQEAKASPLKAYVLTNAENKPVSGVRVGALDFKHETAESLKRYGINENEIKKFTPYFNLSGPAALDALNKNPLTLTQNEYNQINKKVYDYWNDKLKRLPRRLRKSKEARRIQSMAKKGDFADVLQTLEPLRDKYNI